MALSMSVTLDKRDLRTLNRFIKRHPKIIDKSVRKATIKGEGLIIKSTPRGIGNARRNWRHRKIQMMIYEIFNLSEYVKYLVTGTGIHGPKGKIIRPKRAKVLRWIDPKTGDVVFARFTKGMKKQDMITPNIPKIQKLMTKFIKQDVAREWKKRV